MSDPISSTHLVLIPSYNAGIQLRETVLAARAQWAPVWVVIDGSTDGSAEEIEQLAQSDAGLRVYRLPQNQGKGSAVLRGLQEAAAAGFTHVLTMDSDGQHPAKLIPEFMQVSQAQPQALVLGRPVFDDSAPWERKLWREASNFWARFETMGSRLGDSLYGFRVYPVATLKRVMEQTRWMRRFDFDPEACVRLVWEGHYPVNLPAPVRYLRKEEGGVSHFRYLRDNGLLFGMHARLMIAFFGRVLTGKKIRSRQP
jgi:glycosyltransferase involved in cell wall biosynthesis